MHLKEASMMEMSIIDLSLNSLGTKYSVKLKYKEKDTSNIPVKFASKSSVNK